MTKILIIGPSWIGDMVMSQCLYIELKKQHPDCIIDVMAPGWCKTVLARMPEINQTIEMPLNHGDFNFFARYQLGKILRDNHYDHAYILPNSAKSALIPFFANIPTRTGWKGEMRYGLLNDLRNNKKSFNLMIERYISLAHPASAMTGSGCLTDMPFPTLTVDTNNQQQVIEKFNINQNRTSIALCPGAAYGSAKCWPIDHYTSVAKSLIEAGCNILLFGSDNEKKLTDQIEKSLSNDAQHYCHNLAGKTSLTDVIDLLASSSTVIGNDSGLMHVAAAVQCNVVALYGPTTPNYTPPLTDKKVILHTDISCRPCFKRECPLKHNKCMTEISPQQVIAAINNLKAL
ncbi:lipopolysaccharide heptosyltransferase II [Photobacterium carnosum]|uniref:lipopolysaccharide heptosyltransferase II n=1 Tax=Photobacterium carnosum TaxID=2023717 RepID=UPI001E30345B|nr:lipopolysaccharide heptosyltransferase II [Photobacterium carnosum]MCD9529320.1 lipopolysaccharide heptosyltransferase II [Photobacterium carnosum]MCF2153703.1 lipopolysaccharide heptosyltransferase II [Photobacterium carnosum]MCF2215425.1 lipopolysaccharide heptosyltransferase II [Photobacterium carnosum]